RDRRPPDSPMSFMPTPGRVCGKGVEQLVMRRWCIGMTARLSATACLRCPRSRLLGAALSRRSRAARLVRSQVAVFDYAGSSGRWVTDPVTAPTTCRAQPRTGHDPADREGLQATGPGPGWHGRGQGSNPPKLQTVMSRDTVGRCLGRSSSVANIDHSSADGNADGNDPKPAQPPAGV
ncbi:MAG: hypothetical protein JWN06_3473, partial [Propionibacteriaceae bacterium]|nr:hypothetical protein [Propionibacteriaceae bacterium]